VSTGRIVAGEPGLTVLSRRQHTRIAHTPLLRSAQEPVLQRADSASARSGCRGGLRTIGAYSGWTSGVCADGGRAREL
jgi:hypothetical protein